MLTLPAGIVDTDRYTSPVHFPFFASGPDGVHTLEKGTPIVQVIPFRREASSLGGVVRAESRAEADRRERVFRNTIADDGWYRRHARADR